MNILKYLDEWMKMRKTEETYSDFLVHYRHQGRYMNLGFFCLEDLEAFE